MTFSDLTQMAKSYRASGDQLETDYTHGTGFNQDGVSYQHISLAERQRISDLVRQAADLKKVQLANGPVRQTMSSTKCFILITV